MNTAEQVGVPARPGKGQHGGRACQEALEASPAGLGEEGIFAYEIQKGPAEGALQGGQDICF